MFLTACIPLRMIGYTIKIFPKEKLELGNDEVVSIPFETKRNLIIVSAELNGKKGKFLFDSGAFGLADSTFSVDIDSKKKYEVLKGETRPEKDIIISYNLNKYKKLRLGDANLKNVWMGEMFMENLPEHSCYFDGGIIGLNFFDNTYVQLDCNNNELVLSKDKNKLNEFKNYKALKNEQNNVQGAILVRTTINNQEFNLLLDFGFGGGILLHQKSIKNINDSGVYERITKGMPLQVGDGKFGESFPSTHYHDLDASIMFYGHVFNYPVTIISNGNHSPRFSMDGMIGVDFLKHLNPVFDLVDDQVWLQLGEVNINNLLENAEMDDFEGGFSIKNGKLSLNHVEVSNFDTTLFKTESDMYIRMFNGVSVEHLASNEWCNEDFIDNLKALKTDSIYLEMANGEKLSLPK